MSLWNPNPDRTEAEIADELAHSPSGGRLKMWVLGVALALIPIGYGLHCLNTGHARIIGSRGSALDLSGSAAQALAIAYLAVGAFIHAHWFWGLHVRLEPWSPLLKIVSVGVFLGGLGFSVFKVLS